MPSLYNAINLFCVFHCTLVSVVVAAVSLAFAIRLAASAMYVIQ